MENSPKLWLQKLPKTKPDDNKYSKGHAVIVGGPIESTGAARLSAASAVACLRSGAGLVSVVCDGESLPVYAQTLTSVMTKQADDVESFKELISDDRIVSVLIGPGAGVNEDTKQKVFTSLKLNKNMVLDADALTIFKDDPEELFAAIKACDGEVVLTPHEGEFARLFNIEGDKKQKCLEAAKQSGAVVLLKGAETNIADPEGNIVINQNAPVTLATAGSGDVLAGIILGLISPGMKAFDAACAGAWIHGECANIYGSGMIAEDLPNKIPDVLKELVC